MTTSPGVPEVLVALAARRRASESEARPPLYLPSFEEIFRDSQARHTPKPARAAEDRVLTIGSEDDDDFY